MAADLAALPAFFCPITCDVMQDPVIAADGLTYERDAIEKWLELHDKSPGTGAVLPNKHLIANIALRHAIEEWEERYALKLSLSSLQLEAQPLGSGAFKTVYKGVLSVGGSAKPRAVAVLKMKKGSCETEARVFLKLGRHPRVVRFFGQCTDGDDELLVTEFAEHRSLSEAFDTLGDQMTLQHDVVMMQQISQGMEHLVAEGMFHRDLAARNVLLFHFKADDVRATSVKVADFGLSMSAYNQSRVYVQDKDVPTRYLPPEALQRGRYSEKSDIWAFGVTCWEILTRGKIPFYEMPHDREVIRFVCGGGRLTREEVVCDCPDPLWQVIASCWEAETAKRPTFAVMTASLAGVSPSPGSGAVETNLSGVADQEETDAAIQLLSRIRELNDASLKQLLETMRKYPQHSGVQAAGCVAVRTLAVQADNKIKISDAGGIGVVLGAMRKHSEHAGVQEAGCGAVRNLAGSAENEVKISDEGGIAVVLEAMKKHAEHAGVQETGCGAIRNLAGNADNEVKICEEGGIGVVLGAMRKHAAHAGVQATGCGAVRNLAFNADNEVKIASEGGIEVVLEAMRKHAEHAGVQEAGCGAVDNLASNSENQVKIGEAGGIGVVLEAMRKHLGHGGVQEAGCGAVGTLAVIPENKVKIAGGGGIGVVRGAMRLHAEHAGVQHLGSLAVAALE